MNERFALAGKGLWCLFLAAILNLIGGVVELVPLLGGVVAGVLSVAAFLLDLYGPWCAREVHPRFLHAFYAAVAGTIINVLGWFVPEDGIPALIVSVVGIAVQLLLVYCICSASADLLREKGDVALAQRADLIWKLVAGCAAVELVSLLLVWIPVINLLAALASLVAAIVLLVAYVLQVIFYYQAATSLKAA